VAKKLAATTEDRLEFSRRLCASMKNAGINQDGVAKAMGVANPTVHEWMTKGVTPRPQKWKRLARVVGAEVGWLFAQEDETAMPRSLTAKFLQLFEAIGRDRLDYMNSLDVAELRGMIDSHELAHTREARRRAIAAHDAEVASET
jgi:transcriptional regulator with XRE-family HTH domain